MPSPVGNALWIFSLVVALSVPWKATQGSANQTGTAGTVPVLVELFTGAECPPCVAADLAFDALGKTYKPTDVVLLEYHLHIPGPDALTNPVKGALPRSNPWIIVVPLFILPPSSGVLDDQRHRVSS